MPKRLFRKSDEYAPPATAEAETVNRQLHTQPPPLELDVQQELEPLGNALRAQEAKAGALGERLASAREALAQADSAYREAARAAVLGTGTDDAVVKAQAALSAAQTKADGLTAAYEPEKAEFDRMLAEYQTQFQGRLVEKSRRLHAQKFERLKADAEAAQQAAIQHWEALAGALGRLDAATAGLGAEEFYAEQGGNLAGEIWAPVKKLRAKALLSGRRVVGRDDIGVVAFPPEEAK